MYYRKKISVNPGQVSGGPHAEFPLLFNGTDAEIAALAKSDGTDIWFSLLDGTVLKFDRDEYYAPPTPARQIFHVRIPSLATDSEIFVNFGDPDQADLEDKRGTFDGAGYTEVWHLNSPGTNVGVVGSHVATLDGGSQATGKIGLCYDLIEADDDRITVPDSVDWFFAGGDVTLSLWAYLRDDAFGSFIGQFVDNDHRWYILHNDVGGPGAEFRMYSKDDGNVIGPMGGGSILEDDWYHLAYTRVGNTHTQYINGVQADQIIDAGTFPDLNALLEIGSLGDDYQVDGRIDEVRIAKGTGVSGDWLLTEFRNQDDPSAFYTLGALEEISDAAPIPTAGDVSGGTRQARRYRRTRIQRPTKG